MTNDSSSSRIERVGPRSGRNPEYALPVLEHESNIVAAHTLGIVWIVAKMGESSGVGIQSIQSVARGEPQYPVAVLGDVLDVPGQTRGIAAIGAEVEEPSGDGVKSVQALIDGDPQSTGVVLKYRVDEDSADAVGVAGFGFVVLEAIAVIPV